MRSKSKIKANVKFKSVLHSIDDFGVAGLQVALCTLKIAEGYHCKNGLFSSEIHFCYFINILAL